MKKIIALFLMGTLMLFVGVAYAADEEFDSYNINFSTVLSETSTWYKLGMLLSERMKEETNGKVNIRVFPNEQLSGGNQTKGLEMVVTGSTAIDLRATMLWAAVDEKVDAMMLPFFFKDDADAAKKLFGPGAQSFADAMEKRGVKVLGFAEDGWLHLLTNTKPITKLEDMKGLKLRIAPVPLHMASFQALGANPVTMSYSEQFAALQQGTIEGIYSASEPAVAGGLTDVLKYCSVINMNYSTAVLCINLKFWNSLPPKLQEIFERVSQECITQQIQWSRDANAEAMKTFEERGMKINYLSEEETARFFEATRGVYDETVNRIGKEYVESFK